jgi:GT2 family glycosyltransferase
MDWPHVTVVITVRERFSLTEDSLLDFLHKTPEPHQLVYVDVNSPNRVARFLKDAARKHQFTLVRINRYVSPNAARNIGLRYASGEHVIFLDNDVELADGWLTSLVQCAEEESASLVGPLYLHGGLADGLVHMAGGDMKFTGDVPGERDFVQVQRHFLDRIEQVPPDELVRQRSDIVEFHCALVRRSVIDAIGGMDENLLTTREHLDYCLRALDIGGSIFFEPSAVIGYRSPPPFALYDLPYFLLRWSDAWTEHTLRHFARKHGIRSEYVERVAKTRARRQHLVFSWLTPKLNRVLGKRTGQLVSRGLRATEPTFNQVMVRAYALRGRPRHEVIVARDNANSA